VKFHFIAAHRTTFRLRSLCRVLGVSRSGYYAWAGRRLPRQAERNDALLVHIRAAYVRGRQAYGAPRVHQELVQQGIRCGRHRVARLMRREGIVACTERRFRWTATPRTELPAAPDHLQRDFTAAAPNCRWVSDITSVRTGQGWLHLAIVLDLFSRRIVGWAMHATLSQELVRDALVMALRERQPAPGLLFHSDRGGQYLSTTVQGLLDAHGAVASTPTSARSITPALSNRWRASEWMARSTVRTRSSGRSGRTSRSGVMAPRA